MSRAYISALLRQLVRERANYCCEYCLVHETDVLLAYAIDHIIAEQHGGTTTIDNLALACIHCNRKKGPNIASIDFETGQIVPLFHPRRHVWSEHFQIDNGFILPITPIGKVTVHLLALNDTERVRVRQLLVAANRYP